MTSSQGSSISLPVSAVDPAGLAGRAIAAGGAALMALSLFLPAYDFGERISYWDIYERTDLVILVLAAAAIVLFAVSFGPREPACLMLVAAIGGFGLAMFSPVLIEGGADERVGMYLGTLGSLAVVVGAAVAIWPRMRAPAPQQDATPAVAVVAGWYADPSGESRLRYWDGQAWTGQTRQ